MLSGTYFPATNFVNQTLNVVTGQQRDIDWSGVAIAGLMGYVQNAVSNANLPTNSAITNGQPTWTGFWGDIAATAITGVIREGINRNVYKDYHTDWNAFAGDVIGNSLGQAIDAVVDQEGRKVKQQRQINALGAQGRDYRIDGYGPACVTMVRLLAQGMTTGWIRV